MNDLLLHIAAILTALLDYGGTPESNLYIFVNMDMNRYEIVKNTLLAMKAVRISNNYVTLTDKGKKLVEDINALIKK